MNEIEYPSIIRRYFSTLIDGLIILTVYLAIAAALASMQAGGGIVGWIVLLLLFFYEPVCVSSGCTLGQKAMGIRVRNYDDRKMKISLLHSVCRTIFKISLGIISLILISVSKERRSIHDYLTKSIVINSKDA